ncbi:MAG: hypothetical protein EOO83_06795, partial [Oxalobacteraceae bacterium]
MSVTLPRTTATMLDGEALAARLRREMAAQVAGLRARGIAPKMVTVLVGDDPASATYIGRKHADCVEVGIEAVDILGRRDGGHHPRLVDVSRQRQL